MVCPPPAAHSDFAPNRLSGRHGAGERGDALRTLVAAPALGRAVPASACALQPFALADVRLLDGPFKRAQDRDGRELLSLDPEPLLHAFRVNAGLTSTVTADGGWEWQEPWASLRCQGQTLGLHLSACATLWASRGDAALRRRTDSIVRALLACQRALGSGLVCAFPDGELQLRNGFAGRPVIGAPWHTMRTLMAGLRDAHVHAGSAQALAVLRGLAEWIDTAASGSCDSRFRQLLDVGQGGMSEVLAELSTLTGEPRWLELAGRFRGSLLDASAEETEPRSIHELLRQARASFLDEPQPAYADWMERVLVNGILAGKDPDAGREPGVQSPASYGDLVWATEGDTLYLGQFIACELSWREKRLHISQVTAFPERAATRLLVRAERPTRFALRLRHPAWCRKLTVKLDGSSLAVSGEPGGWVEIDRTWRGGEVVDIELPMHLHLERRPDAPELAALMYGPMVLATRADAQSAMPDDEPAAGAGPNSSPTAPLNGRALDDIVRPEPGRPCTFTLRHAGLASSFELAPYHQVAHEPCSLYWPLG